MRSMSPDGAEVWEEVIRKLRSGAMPPPGRPRPDRAVVADVLAWLETELDRAAARDPNPGRTDSVHRLNRAEYQNAVRDLLALDVDVTSLLPADSADEHGFDNIAGMLSVSPTLLDRYLAAARRLSRLAVGLPPGGPTTEEYRVWLDQDDYLGEDLPFGSRGGAAIRHRFPVDGEYVIDVRLYRQLFDVVIGLGSPHEVEIRVDGERILSAVIGGEETRRGPAGRLRRRHLRESGLGAVRPQRRRRTRGAAAGEGRLASRDRFLPGASDRGRGRRSPPAALPRA